MTELGSLAASDPHLVIQTHISENQKEVEETKSLFTDIGKDVTYAGIYEHYGLLRENTILAHAVHLTDGELDIVKKCNSGISHCPTSNFNLTSGVARVGVMLEKGIKVFFFFRKRLLSTITNWKTNIF
jgi:guanine deaminase